MGRLRLLLVHAHPDDETLTHGATVAAALAHGHEVDLVTCTRGEEGEVIGAEHAHRTSDRDDSLGAHRETELAAALDALTAGTTGRVVHHWLDALPPAHAGPAAAPPRPCPTYRDSGMVVRPGGRADVPPDVRPECFAVADVDEAAGRLAALLRRRRPHVLLTYGPHGGYGHPDHVMAHRVAVRALDLAATPGGPDGAGGWVVPWAYGAAADADALRAWLREQRDPHAWDPDGPLPQQFVPPADIDATVDAQRWLPAKAAALRALPTQVTVLSEEPGRASFALSNDVPQPLTGLEQHQLLRDVPGDAVPPAVPVAADLAAGDPLAALLLPAGTRARR